MLFVVVCCEVIVQCCSHGVGLSGTTPNFLELSLRLVAMHALRVHE